MTAVKEDDLLIFHQVWRHLAVHSTADKTQRFINLCAPHIPAIATCLAKKEQAKRGVIASRLREVLNAEVLLKGPLASVMGFVWTDVY